MTLLLLAGTGEAFQIARELSERNVPAIISLAGNARMPAELGLPTRVGGFGGNDGFRAYLAEHAVTAVLDATHPFAARISDRSARICREVSLPYCQVLRPEWRQQPGDRWTFIDREEEAARHIDPGQNVFLATGRQTLDRFANLAHATLICRQLDPSPRVFPFPNGRFLVGSAPFSVEQEKALFSDLNIHWLVVKNAGGEAPATKLTAARELGIRVVMINRPAPPDALRVQTAAEALAWVAGL